MDDSNKISQLEERISKLEKMVEQLTENKGENNALQVLASYDFSLEECRKNSGWKICNAENIECPDALSLKAMQVERTLGVFCDPMLINNDIHLPADEIKRVHVRIKSNVDATQRCMLRVYFVTEKYREWSQAKSVDNYYPAGRLVDVYVDTKNRYWTGNLMGIRIDPVEGLRGSIEIEFIELLDGEDNAKYRIDFTNQKSLEETGWTLRNTSQINCCGKLTFNVNVLEKKRVFKDPFIMIGNIDIDANAAKYIHIKMRVDVDNKRVKDTYMQILFKTKSSNFWTQDKSMRYSYKLGEEIDVYIEIKQLFWKGRIIALRLDPFENLDGVAKIRLIELLNEVPGKSKIDMLEVRAHRLEIKINTLFNQKGK